MAIAITNGVSIVDGCFLGLVPGVDCDPNYANVSLLLPMNGANASTTFTDYSPSPKTVTPIGGTKISTVQFKWNGSSGYFDGTGDYLSVSNSTLAFNTSDFTIEFWVYSSGPSPANPRGHLIEYRTASTQAAINLFWCYNNTTAPVTGAVVIDAINFYYNGNVVAATSPLTYNVWYHFALSRSNGVSKLFVNGTQSGSSISNTTNYSQTTVRIGSNYDNSYSFIGYINDLRITNGVARYTANFTPPAAPFPIQAC